VDLMEFQAKELFAKHGVTTTLGTVVETADEAKAAAEQFGGVTVVKAQVKAGGRGKAGGVKIAKTPDEAFEYASNILGMEIKGLTVNRVLVTPATPPVEEYYFSYLLDRSNRSHLCIVSVEGGVEIEEVAKTNPEAVRKIDINALEGVTPEKAAAIVDEAKFPAELRDQAIEMAQQLWKVYVEEDATLVEVNPLVRLTGDISSRRSTARSPSTTTPRRSATPTTRRFETATRPTRWRPRPRIRTSTTSSSTARSASSATAPAW
jgi:succinyl-CoA synthetase beta subunit